MTPQAAFRHAVGLSQAEVAERYNQRWPGEHPKTFKHVSYWECWQGPAPAALPPPVPPPMRTCAGWPSYTAA